ncbi:DUF1317 family protein [Escherichia coli]
MKHPHDNIRVGTITFVYSVTFDEMVPEFIEKMDEALAEIGFVFGEQWR